MPPEARKQNIARRLLENSRDRDHQSFIRPLDFLVRFELSFLSDTYALQGKGPNGAFSKPKFENKTQDSNTQELGHIRLALLRCTLLTFIFI